MGSKKSSAKQRKSKKQSKSPLPSCRCAETTYGKILDDCSIDVLVEQASGKSQLFVHTSQQEFVASEFQIGGLVFHPGQIPPNYRRAVLFPECVSAAGSPEELFSELRASVEALGFSSDTSAPAAFFCLASCVADVLPQAAPVLSITGPEREPSLLLDVLACTTRRGLRIGEFDFAVLRVLPMEIGPTLLINPSERSSEARQLFRTTNRRGILTRNAGGLVDFYCAKAIYEGRLAYQSREHALRINLTPFVEQHPLFQRDEAARLARHLQPKLAGFRARYSHKVRTSQFDVPDFAATQNCRGERVNQYRSLKLSSMSDILLFF